MTLKIDLSHLSIAELDSILPHNGFIKLRLSLLEARRLAEALTTDKLRSKSANKPRPELTESYRGVSYRILRTESGRVNSILVLCPCCGRAGRLNSTSQGFIIVHNVKNRLIKCKIGWTHSEYDNLTAFQRGISEML